MIVLIPTMLYNLGGWLYKTICTCWNKVKLVERDIYSHRYKCYPNWVQAVVESYDVMKKVCGFKWSVTHGVKHAWRYAHFFYNKYQILCGKSSFSCPDTSFIHLAAGIFHIRVTGPKGGSTITGQNKVTYLLVIDSYKYSSICWKWHFCCRLVCNRSINCYIVTTEKAFQFTCSKT